SYRTNVQALREAATREADLLAGELSQRMQLVTTQLSERVERLMDVRESAPPPVAVVAVKPEPKPAAPAAPATPAATEPDDKQFGLQVADALGEAALLLNTVELPNAPRGGRQNRFTIPGVGRGVPPAASSGSSGSASGAGANARTKSAPASPAAPPPPASPPPLPPPTNAPRVSSAPPPSREHAARSGSGTLLVPPAAPQAPPATYTVVPGPAGDPGAIRIDMTGLW